MRIKGGPRGHQKKVKVLAGARGFRGARSKQFRKANEAVVRAGEHAFAGRKIRRRDMRRLWIARLSGALSSENIMYSRFVAGLKKAKIELDRKSLSELAYSDVDGFKAVLEVVKPHLR